MKSKVRILLMEHDPNDLELVLHELKKSDINVIPHCVQQKEHLIDAIIEFKPDIILSDFTFPSFTAIEAFQLKQQLKPEIPFIIVSGSIGEENAVELIKSGVTDYALKDKLFTLPTKIIRALKETRETIAKQKAEEELIRSERIYKTIASNIPGVTIMIIDKHENYLLVEGSRLPEFGYSKESMLGKCASDVLESDVYSMVGPLYKRVLTGEQFSTEMELQEHHFIIHFVPLETLEKQVHTAMIIAIEITPLKEANNRLEKYTLELERSNKELEQFAYIASHDLQEPLRMVASYVQLLQRRYQDKLDSDANEFIGFAVDGASRMKTLINGLLNYSRINKETMLSSVSLDEILAAVLKNMERSIQESGAVVHVDALPEVQADPTQMIQLFQNLLTNAVKFRKKDTPPIIHINVKRETNLWHFTIQDNGIGIEKKYMQKIFIIFKQLHDQSKYEGTGIGLAIARKIVEQHGGTIWLESEPGTGTTFHFTIKA